MAGERRAAQTRPSTRPATAGSKKKLPAAVSILIALDRRKAKIVCMAPNIAQSETTNHTTKKPDSNNRRVLEYLRPEWRIS